MTREELAKEARRFVSVLDGLEFKSFIHEYKDPVKDTKAALTTYEVRRGPSFIMNADSEEEAKVLADKLNSLTTSFITDEFNRLQEKLEEFKD